MDERQAARGESMQLGAHIPRVCYIIEQTLAVCITSSQISCFKKNFAEQLGWRIFTIYYYFFLPAAVPLN